MANEKVIMVWLNYLPHYLIHLFYAFGKGISEIAGIGVDLKALNQSAQKNEPWRLSTEEWQLEQVFPEGNQ